MLVSSRTRITIAPMAKRRKLQRQAAAGTSRPKLHAKGGKSQNHKPSDPQKRQQQQRQQQQQMKKKHRRQHDEEATIPFEPRKRILLIGEADLSYAASIIRHHGCTNVTATVLEKDHAELVQKYPSAKDNIAVVLGHSDHGISTKIIPDLSQGESNPSLLSSSPLPSPSETHSKLHEQDLGSDWDRDGAEQFESTESAPPPHPPPSSNKVVYNINATKLPAVFFRRPLFDHIIFNFPHVGGKSTDVNRQVRYNQELLVSFFQSALRALAPGGSVVVTLFEGEPYTLWNIRDLGRHAGLQVETSFRFQAAAYPGYRHARTLGVVRNREGEAVGGGWKGEERMARSYVFRRKGDVSDVKSRKKRNRAGDDDDSDDGSSDEE